MLQANFQQQSPLAKILIFLCIWFMCTVIFVILGSIITETIYGVVPSSVFQKDLLKVNLNERNAFKFFQLFSQIFTFGLAPIIFAKLVTPSTTAAYLDLDKKTESPQLLYVIISSLGLMTLMLGLSYLTKFIDMGAEAQKLQDKREAMESVFMQMNHPKDLIANLVIMALIPAICEELFFRSTIQRFANSWVLRPMISIVISSILFASVHGSIYNLAPIILAGFVLGFVYYLTSNLKYNIIMHFLNNGIQIGLVYWALRNKNVEAWMTQTNNIIIIIIIGTILLAFGLFNLYKKRNPLPKNWSV